MRRRDDRDVRKFSGAVQFDTANGTLPRRVNRDVEDQLYGPRMQAVYPSVERVRQRKPALFTLGYGAKPHDSREKKRLNVWLSWQTNLFPAKQILKEFPYRVRECVKRKRRREVLFAFRRAGFSGSAPARSYRRTLFSQYGC